MFPFRISLDYGACYQFTQISFRVLFHGGTLCHISCFFVRCVLTDSVFSGNGRLTGDPCLTQSASITRMMQNAGSLNKRSAFRVILPGIQINCLCGASCNTSAAARAIVIGIRDSIRYSLVCAFDLSR